jgi:hypothetical protein
MSWPERIYLQVGPEDGEFPDDHSEVTWATESVFETDREYVAAAELTRLQRRVQELESIVERLPKTADGVYVVRGVGKVWHPDDESEEPFGFTPCLDEYHSEVGDWYEYSVDDYISKCYSTREAALASRQTQGEKP